MINTNLEINAVQIHYPKKLLCNIYIPPNYRLEKNELTNILTQLTEPFIIVGDLNGHNITWGSETTNTKGKIIENEFDELTILNDNTPTHFNSGTGKFTNIDLSFCSPRIVTSINWEVINQLYGSDHFPIKITHSSDKPVVPNPQITKWKIEEANWQLYKEILDKIDIHIDKYTNINNAVETNTAKIIEAAGITIGKKNIEKRVKTTPWWNENCYIASKKISKHFTN